MEPQECPDLSKDKVSMLAHPICESERLDEVMMYDIGAIRPPCRTLKKLLLCPREQSEPDKEQEPGREEGA